MCGTGDGGVNSHRLRDAPSHPTTAPGLLVGTVRWAKGRPLGAAGAAVALLLFVAALAAPLLARHEPQAQDIAARLQPPSAAHWLGTDQFGRDVLARVLHGLRVSLGVAASAVLLAGLAGGLLGLVSGYVRGPFDLLVQRAVDLLMAFPMLILALLMVGALGSSTGTVALAIAVAYTPLAVRVTRASALALRERPFVDAARATGASDARVLFRHVAPGCLAPWLALVTSELGAAILAESALSYLGVGTREPTPSLGVMLSGAALQHMEQAPWLALWPGVAIALAVLAFTLVGDQASSVPRSRRLKSR